MRCAGCSGQAVGVSRFCSSHCQGEHENRAQLQEEEERDAVRAEARREGYAQALKDVREAFAERLVGNMRELPILKTIAADLIDRIEEEGGK